MSYGCILRLSSQAKRLLLERVEIHAADIHILAQPRLPQLRERILRETKFPQRSARNRNRIAPQHVKQGGQATGPLRALLDVAFGRLQRIEQFQLPGRCRMFPPGQCVFVRPGSGDAGYRLAVDVRHSGETLIARLPCDLAGLATAVDANRRDFLGFSRISHFVICRVRRLQQQ